MPRPPIREPQNEQQQIEALERDLRVARREKGALQHELDVLKSLMTRFLTSEQIIELVHEMNALREKERHSGPVTERPR